MNSEDLILVKRMIDDAVAPLQARIEAIEAQMTEWERRVDGLASDEHYHDEYASVDHVERSENSFNRQMNTVQDAIANLEYRLSDVDRKAARAQSTADNASRGRGGYY